MSIEEVQQAIIEIAKNEKLEVREMPGVVAILGGKDQPWFEILDRVADSIRRKFNYETTGEYYFSIFDENDEEFCEVGLGVDISKGYLEIGITG